MDAAADGHSHESGAAAGAEGAGEAAESSCASTAEQSLQPARDAEDPRVLIPELCRLFYELKWVTGTGGGVAVRRGSHYFIAPSGVQKERMQPEDIFVLRDALPHELPSLQPHPLLPHRPVVTLSAPPAARGFGASQCTPLFFCAFDSRDAACCIHTHSLQAVLVTLLFDREFRISHSEMIKGIRVGRSRVSHAYCDQLVVPIIDNTDEEAALAGSLQQAMDAYPDSNAVLVRRHGLYVWGESWQKAKTQCECYDYLFELAVEMRRLGLQPDATPLHSPYKLSMRTYPDNNRAGQSEAEQAAASR